MSEAIQETGKLLREYNLKCTVPRQAILSCFCEGDCALSAEDIEVRLQAKAPIDLATIYRNLNRFLEQGLLRSIQFGDGITRFELATDEHHHHHVVCRKCQSILPLSGCSVEPLQDAVKALGFVEVEHRLEFFGVCQSCQN